VAPTFGGGIQFGDPAPALVANTTVSGNSAGLRGSGLQIEGLSSVTIVNSTIANNTLTSAIRVFSATAIFENTIVSNPLLPNCLPGGATPVLTSNGGNVASDASCNLTQPTDQPNTDPMLGPLAANGGPTMTHALPEGSPAVDAGNLATCQTTSAPSDQRGEPRIAGASCDAGAYELQLLADLSITKSDDPDPVLAGDPLTYTLTVTNNGPHTALDVTATDTLPAGVTYVSDSCGAGPPVGGVLTWDIGPLALNESVSCTITVTVDAATPQGSITNSAEVSSGTDDPNPANNSASATTRVT
jgi:uncharacterized repeat protein (TIGR01451 family)